MKTYAALLALVAVLLGLGIAFSAPTKTKTVVKTVQRGVTTVYVVNQAKGGYACFYVSSWTCAQDFRHAGPDAAGFYRGESTLEGH